MAKRLPQDIAAGPKFQKICHDTSNMHELFDGKYSPITSTIGFFKYDTELLAQAFLDWSAALQQERGVVVKKIRLGGDFGSAIRRLLPLTSVESRRYLFIPTRSPWTAFLDNGHQGTDPGPLSYLAEKLGTESIRAVYIPKELSKEYPAIVFELYGPHRTDWLNSVRTIYAAYDGYKWDFKTGGEVQDFEEVEMYSKRLVRDRFTFKMLATYLKAFGIEAFEEDFYMPDSREAILIEKFGPIAPAAREFQLADLQ